MQEHVKSGRSEVLSVTRLDSEANDNKPETSLLMSTHAISGDATDSVAPIGYLQVEADGRTTEFLVGKQELTQLLALLYGLEGLSQTELQDRSLGFARSSTAATANPKVDLPLATAIVLISATLMALAYVCI